MSIPLSSGILLADTTPGEILMLNESGSLVPFYIAKHDYESGLNGAGRTLLVRKDCYDERVFASLGNKFSGSSIDTWLNNTWLKLLDADIQAAISKTTFYYTPGKGNNTVTTLQCAVFLLSVTELGKSESYANTEGTALAPAVCSQLAIAHRNGIAVTQWTRTPYTINSKSVYYLDTDGSFGRYHEARNRYGSRPAFTLPGTLVVEQNPDGTYSIAK